MRHARALEVDALEERKLLSKVHHVVVKHPKPVVVVTPITLNGTLTVNAKGAINSENMDGSATNARTLSGTVGTLGAVQGTWSENSDSEGDYLPPDVIRLQNSQGAIVLTFNAANLGKARRNPDGTVSTSVSERLYGGTGAYTKVSEAGTLTITTNKARSVVEALTITSTVK